MTTLRLHPDDRNHITEPPTPGSARIEVHGDAPFHCDGIVYAPRRLHGTVLRDAHRIANESPDPIAYRAARVDPHRREDGVTYSTIRENSEFWVSFEAYRVRWSGYSRFHWRAVCATDRAALEPCNEASSPDGRILVFVVSPGIYQLRFTRRTAARAAHNIDMCIEISRDGALSEFRGYDPHLGMALAREAGVDWQSAHDEIERQIAEATEAAREVEKRLTPFGGRNPDRRWQTMERRWFALDHPNWYWFAENIRVVEFWKSSSSVDLRDEVVTWVRRNANEQTITQLARAQVDDLVDEGEPLYVTPHMVTPWERYKDAALYVVQACEWARERGVELVFPYEGFPEQLYEVANQEIVGVLSPSRPFVAPWENTSPRRRTYLGT